MGSLARTSEKLRESDSLNAAENMDTSAGLLLSLTAKMTGKAIRRGTTGVEPSFGKRD